MLFGKNDKTLKLSKLIWLDWLTNFHKTCAWYNTMRYNTPTLSPPTSRISDSLGRLIQAEAFSSSHVINVLLTPSTWMLTCDTFTEWRICTIQRMTQAHSCTLSNEMVVFSSGLETMTFWFLILVLFHWAYIISCSFIYWKVYHIQTTITTGYGRREKRKK